MAVIYTHMQPSAGGTVQKYATSGNWTQEFDLE